ncbi:MAG: oligosaccharide flippase family protein [Ignavibacteria bacterium]|nr:oligosaccharide flippase family protein [Ignavibacteria bacterium]
MIKHTFIYGLSNVATKASGIVLLPLYTSYLSLGDFGVLGLLDATIFIVIEFISLGQGQALVMLNNSEEYSTTRKEIFFTIFSFSVSICLIFMLLGFLIIPEIVSIFSFQKIYLTYLKIILVIIPLRVLNNILFNKFRADEDSVKYTTYSVIKLFLLITAAFYFLVISEMGMIGILYSYIISDILILVIMFLTQLGKFKVNFYPEVIRVALGFGLPLVFGSIAMMILNLSDRYLIKIFMYDEMVGLYDLGYRFAGVLNMFIIMPVSLTLVPYAYKIYKRENDKEFYSKLLSYLTMILVWIGLGLSLFSEEIIRIFVLNPSFWPAYKLVPIIVLAYVFFGMRIVSSLGMYLTKKTKFVALTTIIAASINIVLNIIFIPIYGITAAAFTTLISFLILYFLSQYYSNKYYDIPFENFKLFKIIVLGIVFYFLSDFFIELNSTVDIISKTMLLVLFPFALLIIRGIDISEIKKWKEFFISYSNSKSDRQKNEK